MGRIRTAVPTADLHFLKLDLASLDSVRDAAAEFLNRGEPLDLLVNNAGVAGSRGITKDGFELTFGVNHVGHFLFTLLLADKLVESAPSRVVTVASRGHYGASGIDWDAVRQPTRAATGFPEYQVSKLANVLFSAELHRRFHDRGVSTYSLHPGVVASDIWRRIPWPVRSIMKRFMISGDEGATTTLHCALAEDADSGLYWDECAPKKPSRPARDEALAAELWQRSLDWVADYLT